MSWTPDQERAIARSVFRHIHPLSERDPLMLDSCAACVLMGRGAFTNERGNLEPNYAGWHLVYTQARRPIPEAFRAAFEEIRSPDFRGGHYEPYRQNVLKWLAMNEEVTP